MACFWGSLFFFVPPKKTPQNQKPRLISVDRRRSTTQSPSRSTLRNDLHRITNRQCANLFLGVCMRSPNDGERVRFYATLGSNDRFGFLYWFRVGDWFVCGLCNAYRSYVSYDGGG